MKKLLIYLIIVISLSSCYRIQQEVKKDDHPVIGEYLLHTMVWLEPALGIKWSKCDWSDNIEYLDSIAPIRMKEARKAKEILKKY